MSQWSNAEWGTPSSSAFIPEWEGVVATRCVYCASACIVLTLTSCTEPWAFGWLMEQICSRRLLLRTARRTLYVPRMVSTCANCVTRAVLWCGASSSSYHTFLELLPGLSDISGHPEGTPSPLPKDFVNHIKFADYSCGAMKINLAVDALPNFACAPNSSDGRPGPQHQGVCSVLTRVE